MNAIITLLNNDYVFSSQYKQTKKRTKISNSITIQINPSNGVPRPILPVQTTAYYVKKANVRKSQKGFSVHLHRPRTLERFPPVQTVIQLVKMTVKNRRKSNYSEY